MSPIAEQLLAEQHPSRRAVVLAAADAVADVRPVIELGAFAAAYAGWRA